MFPDQLTAINIDSVSYQKKRNANIQVALNNIPIPPNIYIYIYIYIYINSLCNGIIGVNTIYANNQLGFTIKIKLARYRLTQLSICHQKLKRSVKISSIRWTIVKYRTFIRLVWQYLAMIYWPDIISWSLVLLGPVGSHLYNPPSDFSMLSVIKSPVCGEIRHVFSS